MLTLTPRRFAAAVAAASVTFGAVATPIASATSNPVYDMGVTVRINNLALSSDAQYGATMVDFPRRTFYAVTTLRTAPGDYIETEEAVPFVGSGKTPSYQTPVPTKYDGQSICVETTVTTTSNTRVAFARECSVFQLPDQARGTSTQTTK